MLIIPMLRNVFVHFLFFSINTQTDQMKKDLHSNCYMKDDIFHHFKFSYFRMLILVSMIFWKQWNRQHYWNYLNFLIKYYDKN